MTRGPLLLLRHGRTAWSAAGRITGWEDPPLDATGEEEARRAGRRLAGLGVEVSTVLTSCSRRAGRTAELVLASTGAAAAAAGPVLADWRLNERHYGHLHGLDRAVARERFGKERERAWRHDPDLVPPPLFRSDPRHPVHDPRYREVDPARLPGAESLAQLGQRVGEVWRELAEPRLQAGAGVLVVGHCHALRSLLAHLAVTDVARPFASTGSGVLIAPDGAVRELEVGRPGLDPGSVR